MNNGNKFIEIIKEDNKIKLKRMSDDTFNLITTYQNSYVEFKANRNGVSLHIENSDSSRTVLDDLNFVELTSELENALNHIMDYINNTDEVILYTALEYKHPIENRYRQIWFHRTDKLNKDFLEIFYPEKTKYVVFKTKDSKLTPSKLIVSTDSIDVVNQYYFGDVKHVPKLYDHYFPVAFRDNLKIINIHESKLGD